MLIQLTDKPIPVSLIQQSLKDPSCGAFVEFQGIVRNHHEGAKVSRLFYEAHPSMALGLMGKIAKRAMELWPVQELAILHRLGVLPVGEVALYMGLLAPHRREAFEACQFLIDEIKKKVPIWKKEFYVGDTDGHWVEGCHG